MNIITKPTDEVNISVSHPELEVIKFILHDKGEEILRHITSYFDMAISQISDCDKIMITDTIPVTNHFMKLLRALKEAA